ncbi:DNA-binding protein,hypothetical protein, partial [Burkholderia pseudomallei]
DESSQRATKISRVDSIGSKLLSLSAIGVHLVNGGHLGGFNRSSQHWIVEQILGTRPELPQASSSQAFCRA